MQAILRRLLDRIDAIAEQHGEVGDTAVRDAISEAVFDGFLRPSSGFALPDRYALFSEEGDLLVKRALAEFLPAADHSAAEAGLSTFFYLLPTVVRTYAPIGQTPLLHERLSREHLSKDFLASGTSSRLQLEQLPGYAPDLSPDEGIWKHLKYVELKNVRCRNLSKLRKELCKAKERFRHKKHVLLGCVRQPGFEVY